MPNWMRKLLSGFSFTAAFFVFQACYGSPQDMGLDVKIEGTVYSEDDNIPIEGVKVTVAGKSQYQITDSNGKFSFYTEKEDGYDLLFEDVDKSIFGSYKTKDTTIVNIEDVISLSIVLQPE